MPSPPCTLKWETLEAVSLARDGRWILAVTQPNDELPTMPSNDPVADAAAADDASTVWLVSFGDDDDRELTTPAIMEHLSRGEIGAETIVWRDGLDRWHAIAEVPALAKLLPGGRARMRTHVGGFSGPTASPRSDTTTAQIPRPARKSEPPPLPQRKSVPPAARAGRKSEPPPLPKRRSKPPPAPSDDEPISVDAESLPPSADPSITVPQPRALSAGTLGTMGEDSDEEPPSSAGTPALSSLASLAPVNPRASVADELLGLEGNRPAERLAPPSIDVSNLAASPNTSEDEAETRPRAAEPRRGTQAAAAKRRQAAPPKESSRRGIGLALVALIVSVTGWAVLRARSEGSETTEETTTQARAPEPAPAPTRSPQATKAEPPSEPSAAPEPAEEAEPEPAPAVAPQKASPAAPSPSPQSAGPAAASSPPSPARTPPPSPEPREATGAATDKAGKPTAKAEPKPEQEEVELAGPFDKAAAAAALRAAAAQAGSCRKEGDPTGQANVRVTFAPSGRATRAVVNGPPFAGTATGGCIAATLRKARIPPFSGAHVSVTKTLIIR